MNAYQVVDEMPEGYHWADEDQCVRWDIEPYVSNMVQVRVGGTDDEPWTDLAIRIVRGV